MIDYGRFRFAAPPRTGTTWFRKACALTGLGDPSRTDVHFPFRDEHSANLRVCLVRHPAHWLISYHTALQGGKIGVPIVDRYADLYDPDVSEFVFQYLMKFPGTLFEMFRAYHADTFLKIEDAPWCFVTLAESLSIRVPSSIHDLTPQNVSKRAPVLENRLFQEVCNAEWELLEHFEY